MPSRIIPAYAGNTSSSLSARRSVGDHPRVCGEHRSPTGWNMRQTGSSPRMRGTHFVCFVDNVIYGIIPAYAGNTVIGRWTWNIIRDHPRVCGEHMASNGANDATLGSSPRMRGTPSTLQEGLLRSGIIPAYAGNTCSGTRLTWIRRDHPRVCGEHRWCGGVACFN